MLCFSVPRNKKKLIITRKKNHVVCRPSFGGGGGDGGGGGMQRRRYPSQPVWEKEATERDRLDRAARPSRDGRVRFGSLVAGAAGRAGGRSCARSGGERRNGSKDAGRPPLHDIPTPRPTRRHRLAAAAAAATTTTTESAGGG